MIPKNRRPTSPGGGLRTGVFEPVHRSCKTHLELPWASPLVGGSNKTAPKKSDNASTPTVIGPCERSKGASVV